MNRQEQRRFDAEQVVQRLENLIDAKILNNDEGPDPPLVTETREGLIEIVEELLLYGH